METAIQIPTLIYYRVIKNNDKNSRRKERFKEFQCERRESDTDINQKILKGAHLCATKWEFGIIEQENIDDYEIDDIRADLGKRWESLNDLDGIRQYHKVKNFIDLCGKLRF